LVLPITIFRDFAFTTISYAKGKNLPPVRNKMLRPPVFLLSLPVFLLRSKKPNALKLWFAGAAASSKCFD